MNKRKLFIKMGKFCKLDSYNFGQNKSDMIAISINDIN